MYLFKDGKFHFGGIQVAIPDGFYLDIDPEEVLEEGMVLQAPSNAYQILLDIQCGSETLQEIFSKELEEGILHIQQEISPISLNGLEGHDVIFHCGKSGYYEALLPLREDLQLMLEIRTPDWSELDAVLSSQVVKEFFANLQVSEAQ